jgi:hypothetical protein
VVAPISVIVKVGLQKIGEKEDFQDDKHDEELNQNDQPNLLSPAWHRTETFGIKMINPPEDIHG